MGKKQTVYSTCRKCFAPQDPPRTVRFCKPCHSAYEKERHLANPDKRREYLKRWAKKNPDKARAKIMNWRSKNRDKWNAYQRELVHKKKVARVAALALPRHPACPCAPKKPRHVRCSRCHEVCWIKGGYCKACLKLRWHERIAAGCKPLQATIHYKCCVCKALFDPPKKQSRCSRCSAQKARDDRARFPERVKATNKKSREKHSKRRNATTMEWRKGHPENRRSASSRSTAKRREATGSHTIEEWRRLLREHDYRCVYCGVGLTEDTASRDHATPLARGGSDNADNIVPACLPCNIKKHAKTREEFVAYLAKKAQQITP